MGNRARVIIRSVKSIQTYNNIFSSELCHTHIKIIS